MADVANDNIKCVYLGDEDAGVVNTEWVASVTLASDDAQTKRSTGFEYRQCLYIDNKTVFSSVKPTPQKWELYAIVQCRLWACLSAHQLPETHAASGAHSHVYAHNWLQKNRDRYSRV